MKKKLDTEYFEPDVICTRNLLIWSQMRYRCATSSILAQANQIPFYLEFEKIENNIFFSLLTHFKLKKNIKKTGYRIF